MAVERQREYALPKDVAPDECTIGRVAGLEFEHSDIRYHGNYIGIGRRLPRDESNLPDEAGIPVKLT